MQTHLKTHHLLQSTILHLQLYTLCPSLTTAIILGLAITNKTDNSVTASVQFTDASDSNATRLLLNEVTIPSKYNT